MSTEPHTEPGQPDDGVEAPAAQTTVIKSRLSHPDNTPMPGVRVDLYVRSSTTWSFDRKARILGHAHTWTNHEGCWRANLLPYTAYSDTDYVYVEVREDGKTAGYIRVPPKPEGEECWFGDLLINPPPDPAVGRNSWCPISNLTDLHDVDRVKPTEGDVLVYQDGRWQPGKAPAGAANLAGLEDVNGEAIDSAPEGAVLVKKGDTWTAMPMNLSALADIDQWSLAAAEPGDYLEYLDTGLWGVNTGGDNPTPPDPVSTPEGSFTDPGADVDPTGYTVRLTITNADPARFLSVDWGDGSDPETLDAGPQTVDHTYDWSEQFWPSVSYLNPAEGDGALSEAVDIPFPRALIGERTLTDPTPRPSPVLSFDPVSGKHGIIKARLAGATETYLLYWGDGETLRVTTPNQIVQKRNPYPAAGAYTLVAKSAADHTVLDTCQVVIRETEKPSDLVVFSAREDDPQTIVATVQEALPVDLAGKLWISWGDKTDPEEFWAVPGATVEHRIDQPGEYTRILRDLSSRLVERQTYTVAAKPGPDPNGHFAKAPGSTDGMTVRFTLTEVQEGKTVVVEWGDTSLDDSIIENAKVGDYVDAEFVFPDIYLPVVYYQDGTGRPLLTEVIEVPYA